MVKDISIKKGTVEARGRNGYFDAAVLSVGVYGDGDDCHGTVSIYSRRSSFSKNPPIALSGKKHEIVSILREALDALDKGGENAG